MKRVILLFAIIGIWCGVVSAERYEVKVGDFSALKVMSSVNVDYVCSADSAGMASFTADPSMASVIGFTLAGDELRVAFTTDDLPTGPLPRVTVYSTFLTKVTNTSDSIVRVVSDLKCPTFSATQQGNGSVVVRNINAGKVDGRLLTGKGQVVLYGTTDKANYTMVGAGLIQADGLQAKEVNIKATGTGQIGCWVTDALIVKGLGSTTVYYRGNPSITKKFALGVKVEPLRQ